MIAVYGGSFLPPHAGHRRAAEAVLAFMGQAGRLLIVPGGIRPHGNTEKPVLTREQRMALCRLAFGDLPGTEISDTELSREGPAYTVDTLKEIHGKNPGEPLWLVLGSDLLEGFPSWVRLEEILSLCTPAVLLRNGESPEAQTTPLLERSIPFTVIPMTREDVSATEIRRALKRGEQPAAVRPDVLRYIEQNGLFR